MVLPCFHQCINSIRAKGGTAAHCLLSAAVEAARLLDGLISFRYGLSSRPDALYVNRTRFKLKVSSHGTVPKPFLAKGLSPNIKTLQGLNGK